MNLIACDQNCRHQKEGYCALNHTAQLTASSAVMTGCGYYEGQERAGQQPVKEESAKHSERL